MLELEDWSVSGEILLDAEGAVFLQLGKKPERKLFAYWTQHVFLNLWNQRQGGAGLSLRGNSKIVSGESRLCLPALSLADAEHYARELLALYAEIERSPVFLLPRTAYASLLGTSSTRRSAYLGFSETGLFHSLVRPTTIFISALCSIRVHNRRWPKTGCRIFLRSRFIGNLRRMSKRLRRAVHEAARHQYLSALRLFPDRSECRNGQDLYTGQSVSSLFDRKRLPGRTDSGCHFHRSGDAGAKEPNSSSDSGIA